MQSVLIRDKFHIWFLFQKNNRSNVKSIRGKPFPMMDYCSPELGEPFPKLYYCFPFLQLEINHHQLRLCPNPVMRSPNSKAGRNIILCFTFFQITMSHFVHGIY